MASRCVRAYGRALLWRAAGALPAALIASSLAQGCGVDRTLAGYAGPLDAGTPDASEGGIPPDDGSACQPGDVQTYVPGGYHPAAAAFQGVCDDVQMQGFYDACLGPQASTDTCDAFSKADAGNAACKSCILTPEMATAYGPLVEHGTFITENVGGCIELFDPSGLPCAKEQQALLGCQLAACEANCPVHDPTTRATYDTCAATAATAGCLAYSTRAACAQDGGASANCVGLTFKEFYYTVVQRFCGPQIPLDATPPYETGASDATIADAADAHATDGAATEAASDAVATDAPAADARADAASSD